MRALQQGIRSVLSCLSRPRTWIYTVGCVHGGTLLAYRNGGTGPVKELLDTSNTCGRRSQRARRCFGPFWQALPRSVDSWLADRFDAHLTLTSLRPATEEQPVSIGCSQGPELHNVTQISSTAKRCAAWCRMRAEGGANLAVDVTHAGDGVDVLRLRHPRQLLEQRDVRKLHRPLHRQRVEISRPQLTMFCSLEAQWRLQALSSRVKVRPGFCSLVTAARTRANQSSPA